MSGQQSYALIYVNGDSVGCFEGEELAYIDFINFTTDSPCTQHELFSITYRKGPGSNPEGILAPKKTVIVTDGMIFDVIVTS
jgi:hypothetical protein